MLIRFGGTIWHPIRSRGRDLASAIYCYYWLFPFSIVES